MTYFPDSNKDDTNATAIDQKYNAYHISVCAFFSKRQEMFQ